LSAIRRQDVALIVGLLLLAVVLPFLTSAIAGTVEIPRNDDWSFRRIAVDLASTGRLALDGMSAMMLIGQVIVTQPLLWLFQSSPWAFAAAGLIFATAGILSSYVMGRQILTPVLAAMAAGLLAIFPGYLAYATSYMTDVPAIAAAFACLACGMVAVRRRTIRLPWLAAAVGLGLFAFSIREFTLAAPAAVLLAAILTGPRQRSTWLLTAGVVAGCIVLYLWRASLPGQMPPVVNRPLSILQSAEALSSVAFAIAPAALLGFIRWRPHLHRIDVAIGTGIGVVLAFMRLTQGPRGISIPQVALSNMASQFGVPAADYLTGARPLLFGKPVWMAVNGLALLSTVVVIGVGTGILGAHLRRTRGSIPSVIERCGSPAGVLVLFAITATAGLFVFSLTRGVSDRYLWPLTTPLAVLYLFVSRDLRPGSIRGAAPAGPVAAGSALVLATALVGLSFAYMLNANAFDAARWQAGERLVEMGLRPDSIDAGYEWMGDHASVPGNSTVGGSIRPFYRNWWPAFQECAVVSSRPKPPEGASLVATADYRLELFAGRKATLYLYRFDRPGCAPPV
jgi:4-amino-4-deoxy-L-arabinose transferase-like glycosyltransferase